jgi:acyl dehydratase
MPTLVVFGIEGARSLVGRQLGPTAWRRVTQEDIDIFAERSGDDFWIHVDVDRARRESPFGGTIAHGNLTLSLAEGFRKELVSIEGFPFGVNYGWDRIRFPSPVPVDSQVRGRAEMLSFRQRDDGWWENATRFTLEVEGDRRPCFVGDSITRVRPAEDGGPAGPSSPINVRSTPREG